MNQTLHLTPQPTLSFSFYNALTTIQAAEARQREKVPPDCECDKQYYLNGGPARGSSRTTNLRAASLQTSDGPQRASPGILRKGVGSGSGSGLLKRRLSSSKSNVLRLPSPKPSQEHVLKASKIDVDQATTADTSVGHDGYQEDEPPLFQATVGKYGSGDAKCSSGLTASSLPVSRSNRSSHAVDGMTSAGCGPTEGPSDRTSDDDDGGHCARNKASGAPAVLNDDVNCNSDGDQAPHSAIQHGRRAGDNATNSYQDRPSVAEIIEVRFDFIFLPVNVFAGATVIIRLSFDVLYKGTFKLRLDSPRITSPKSPALFPYLVVIRQQV